MKDSRYATLVTSGLRNEDVMADAAVELAGISHFVHSRGQKGAPDHCVIDDVSFTAHHGEILGLVGPSGCGKTTLLNMVAGLVRPTHGAITRLGSEVVGPDRNVGYMFARAGLLPWRTAVRNVEMGLEVRGVPKAERRETALRYLDLVSLGKYADWYPLRLSQGMRQRVSLARTLATEPDLLLMDEPFAALDVQTKSRLQQEFLTLCEGTGKTVIWVTHDVSEAVALCDRVIVLSPTPGRLKTDVEVPIARPRTLSALRTDSKFQALCDEVWGEFEG